MLKTLFGGNTLESILGQFTKVINDLETLMEKHRARQQIIQGTIGQLEAENALLDGELVQAFNAKQKLQELIGA